MPMHFNASTGMLMVRIINISANISGNGHRRRPEIVPVEFIGDDFLLLQLVVADAVRVNVISGNVVGTIAVVVTAVVMVVGVVVTGVVICGIVDVVTIVDFVVILNDIVIKITASAI